MNVKKIILVVILFVIGIILFIYGIISTIMTYQGNKIEAEEFRQIVEKNKCDITDVGGSATGNVKNQMLVMGTNCPYSLAYIEFSSTDSATSYADTNAETIKNNNGDVVQSMDIRVMNYREVSTLGDAYNIIIAQDDMVILGASPTDNKDDLDNMINELNIRGNISWNYIGITILGLIVGLAAIILLIIFLVQNKSKNKNTIS